MKYQVLDGHIQTYKTMWHNIGNSTLVDFFVGNAFVKDIWIGNQLIWHNAQHKLIAEDERNIIMDLFNPPREHILCVDDNDQTEAGT